MKKAKLLMVRGLKKKYRKKAALKGLDLEVDEFMVYALLGPNGAGKSTTLSILSGLLKADEGGALVNGLSVEEEKFKDLIGLQPQDAFLLGGKVKSVLSYLSRLKRDTYPREMVKELGVDKFEDKRMRELSHGQRKLVQIVQAFMKNPLVVFLDEPLSGLDPQKIVTLRKFIKKESKKRLIVFSTHNIDEASRLAKKAGIIFEGRLRKEIEVKKVKSLEEAYLKALK